MKVWTSHPGSLNLVDPNLVLDASKGRYFYDTRYGLRYADMRSRLVHLLPTDQFLWCVTNQENISCPEDAPGSLEWELDIDPGKVLGFINRSSLGRRSFTGEDEDWNQLFVNPPDGPDTGVNVLVPFPHHQIKRNGLARPPRRIEITYS